MRLNDFFKTRPHEPRRLRISFRRLMAVVALVSVLLTVYVVLVDLPIQRRRFRNADRAVSLQVQLLRRAVTQEQKREQDEKERASKCRDRAEEDRGKAEKSPEGSEERAGYSKVVALWDQHTRVASQSAERAAAKAKKYQANADALADERQKVGSTLAALEKLAQASETFLAVHGNGENFPSELEATKVRLRAEHQAKSGGRSTFPTAFGPRTSAIEATAIWSATQAFTKLRPGVSLNGFEVKARNPSQDQPFSWDVTFINPRKGQSHRVMTGFSDVSVTDYLLKNP